MWKHYGLFAKYWQLFVITLPSSHLVPSNAWWAVRILLFLSQTKASQTSWKKHDVNKMPQSFNNAFILSYTNRPHELSNRVENVFKNNRSTLSKGIIIFSNLTLQMWQKKKENLTKELTLGFCVEYALQFLPHNIWHCWSGEKLSPGSTSLVAKSRWVGGMALFSKQIDCGDRRKLCSWLRLQVDQEVFGRPVFGWRLGDIR